MQALHDGGHLLLSPVIAEGAVQVAEVGTVLRVSRRLERGERLHQSGGRGRERWDDLLNDGDARGLDDAHLVDVLGDLCHQLGALLHAITRTKRPSPVENTTHTHATHTHNTDQSAADTHVPTTPPQTTRRHQYSHGLVVGEGGRQLGVGCHHVVGNRCHGRGKVTGGRVGDALVHVLGGGGDARSLANTLFNHGLLEGHDHHDQIFLGHGGQGGGVQVGGHRGHTNSSGSPRVPQLNAPTTGTSADVHGTSAPPTCADVDQ